VPGPGGRDRGPGAADINEAVEEYVDLLAERVVQLAGVAQGTLGAVISGTALPPYPPCGSDAAQHLEALATALRRSAAAPDAGSTR
jgi:DNA-binding ferritin-like protein